MSRNEADTRKEFIDRALETAEWNLKDSNHVGIEIPVDGYDAEPWNGVTDYCLYLPNGEVIAVVEAKRQSRDPRVAEQQVRHYVTEIEKRQSFRPFAFMSNGDRTFFWDVGNENKRPVAGFFSLFVGYRGGRAGGDESRLLKNKRIRKDSYDYREC